MASLEYENEFRAKGYNRILGIDEAGRGPLAGPLVIAGVVLPLDFNNEEINDSKQLSDKKRREMYNIIMKNALDVKVNSEEENVIPIQVDITDVQSVKNAFEKVKTYTDSIYAIIHFAGIYMLDSLIEIDENDFEKIFKINVFGAFYVNKIFAPLLERDSRILMTTSELAPLDPLPFTGIYAVTKSALVPGEPQ